MVGDSEPQTYLTKTGRSRWFASFEFHQLEADNPSERLWLSVLDQVVRFYHRHSAFDHIVYVA
jgi:hypothetical protein